MKKIFLIIGLVFIALSLYSQEDEQWINRTRYEVTENCPDTINCFSQVYVDVNLSVIPDSAQILFNIGTTYGAGDIFTRQLQKTEAAFTLPDVEETEGGNISVYLGEYLIDEHFFVDIQVR